MCTEEIWKPDPVKNGYAVPSLSEYHKKKGFMERKSEKRYRICPGIADPDGDDLFAED